jgi:hypothetical protein
MTDAAGRLMSRRANPPRRPREQRVISRTSRVVMRGNARAPLPPTRARASVGTTGPCPRFRPPSSPRPRRTPPRYGSPLLLSRKSSDCHGRNHVGDPGPWNCPRRCGSASTLRSALRVCSWIVLEADDALGLGVRTGPWPGNVDQPAPTIQPGCSETSPEAAPTRSGGGPDDASPSPELPPLRVPAVGNRWFDDQHEQTVTRQRPRRRCLLPASRSGSRVALELPRAGRWIRCVRS